MKNIFKREGFIWEKCPYAVWVVFSGMKCLVIWYLPLLLAIFINVLCISIANTDGKAEKKIKDFWQKRKVNSRCGEIGMTIGAQLLFLVGVATTVPSVLIGGAGSDHFNSDSGWFPMIILGGLALVASQCLMVLAYVEYEPPEIKKEPAPVRQTI